jgi:hypothetical protein
MSDLERSKLVAGGIRGVLCGPLESKGFRAEQGRYMIKISPRARLLHQLSASQFILDKGSQFMTPSLQTRVLTSSSLLNWESHDLLSAMSYMMAFKSLLRKCNCLRIRRVEGAHITIYTTA